MSFELMSKGDRRMAQPSWTNMAFIVEAMLLLVFLVASLAVFMQLFSAAAQRSAESRDLTDAVAVASTTAERFAVDPQGIPEVSHADDLTVTCTVEPDSRDSGTLYRANIAVYKGDEPAGEPVYSLSTSTYVSQVT